MSRQHLDWPEDIQMLVKRQATGIFGQNPAVPADGRKAMDSTANVESPSTRMRDRGPQALPRSTREGD